MAEYFKTLHHKQWSGTYGKDDCRVKETLILQKYVLPVPSTLKVSYRH